MKTIAIINRKGGVGKTATAHTLGAGLMKTGKRVLFVDLDSQMNLSFVMNAAITPKNSMALLMGEVTTKEAIQHTPNGDIIAASEDLAAADMTFTQKRKEYILREALDEVKKAYDYVIIDTPAALGTLTTNALTAADYGIITVQPEVFSLQGLGQLYKIIETVTAYSNKDLKIKGILITRFDKKTVLSRDMQSDMNEAAQQLHTFVYKYPIRECIAVKEAQARQTDIFTYSPRSNAAKDYKAFLEEFIRREKK